MTHISNGSGDEELSQRSWRWSLIRFIFVGATTTIIYFVILLISAVFFHIIIYISITIAYTFAVIFNYYVHYYWTYKTDRPHRSSMVRYVTFFLLALGFNIGVTELFIANFQVNYFLVQISLATFIAAVSFLSQFVWIFSPAARPKSNSGDLS